MIQLQFLNKLLETKNIKLIRDNNLGDEYFNDYKHEFKFITNFIDKYGNIPDKETFISQFPNFNLIEVHESNEYLLDELFKDRQDRYIVETVNKIAEAFKNGKHDEAFDIYINSVDKKPVNKKIRPVDLIADSEIRYKAYLDKCNDFNKYYVSTGFKELDDMIGGWDRTEELATIAARTNQGKCLQKGTKILMADGSNKCVEDIQVGDKVQSFNSINTVLALHRGKAPGYIINTYLGDTFTISENHILTLYDISIKSVNIADHLIDIKIEDYIELSLFRKKQLFLYYPSVEYAEDNNLDMPPYIWGYTHTMDNTNIPKEYYINSKKNRLEVLAGIIDKIGCFSLSDYSYVLTTLDTNVLDNCIKLGRSLGFKCSINKTKILSDNSINYIITISGNNLKSIPTQKVIIPNNVIMNKTNTDIPITYFTVCKTSNDIEYFGFKCSGDERYLLSNYILTHNTWILIKCMAAALEQGLRVGIYSGEMSENKVGYRFDTMLGHISNSALVRGDLTVRTEYEQHLNYLKTKYPNACCKVLTPKMINGPAGVSALRTFIENENLEILFIDQHSLLEDDHNAKNPIDRASNISKDLKNLQVLKKIPIISVSQQNRASTDKGVGTEHIAQSDRISQDSTIILFFEQNKDKNILTLNLVKSRDSVNMKKIRYAFDFNMGIFRYIPEIDEGKPLSENEEVLAKKAALTLRQEFNEKLRPNEQEYF